ncbi:MAG: hypothetical protein LC620_05790 [Halobacteriales archaeon]|nr:hypothetical protein [Halobacteriales archaeon]
MPTGKANDVIPVRLSTKEALRLAKGDATYDETLQVLLEGLTPDELASRVEGARAAEARRERARQAAEGRTDPGRAPEKQLLIAEVAELGRRRWLEEGRLERLGPRRYRFRVGGEAPGTVQLRVRPGRGLPPGKGAKRR